MSDGYRERSVSAVLLITGVSSILLVRYAVSATMVRHLYRRKCLCKARIRGVLVCLRESACEARWRWVRRLRLDDSPDRNGVTN